MARYDPPDYGHGGNGGGDGQEPLPEEPLPGWRKPIALVGWCVLIAILLGLIIWGIIQLAQGSPPQRPATTTNTTTTTTTTPPSSTAPVLPPTDHRPTNDETTTTTTADTETPRTSITGTGTPTSTTNPWPRALPRLPSVIRLPPLPGLPTAITLPPGL